MLIEILNPSSCAEMNNTDELSDCRIRYRTNASVAVDALRDMCNVRSSCCLITFCLFVPDFKSHREALTPQTSDCFRALAYEVIFSSVSLHAAVVACDTRLLLVSRFRLRARIASRRGPTAAPCQWDGQRSAQSTNSSRSIRMRYER